MDNVEDESPHSTDTEDVENVNNSVDDGGPLEVSALSVKDDDDDNDKEEDDDDDDNEMPPKITMEDLADDLDSTEENNSDQGTDSPKVKFEELNPRKNSAPEKAVTNVSDSNRREDMSAEDAKVPKESRVKIEDIGSHYDEDHNKDSSYDSGHSKLNKDKFGRYHEPSSQRNWQTKDYSGTESYYKYSHLHELDEDVILMRAKAALRRADRYSPPKGRSTQYVDPHSLTLSDLSLNVSSTWEPVRMSTPLVPQAYASSNYRSYAGHDSYHGYKSIGRSHRHNSADVAYGEESGLGRSGTALTSHHHHHHHGVSGRRLSPAVEDIIRRRKLQEKHEGRYAFSTPWRKPSSPLYDSKFQFSRTHPMSYVEWKALHWRPPRELGQWRDKHWHYTDPYEADLKRSSWPPKPFPSKLVYGSRPLSPPVTFPPAKVPRAVPGGYVSKMAIPSYPDSSDSGYSDWQQSTSRWDNTMRSHHSSLGYTGETWYY